MAASVSHARSGDAAVAASVACTGWAKNGAALFYGFRSIDQIGTKLGTNQRYFILSITS